MIEFKYTEEIRAAHASVSVITTCESFEAVVETFKTFARLAGYHADTVDRLELRDDDRQGLRQQADANQLELFPDEHETGGI